MSSALPAALCALAWLAGAALQLQQPVLWPSQFNAALAAGGLLIAVPAWQLRRRAQRRRWQLAGTALAASAVAALAFGSTAWRAGERLHGVLPAALEGRDIVATGVIAELPRSGPAGTRFVFATEHAQFDGKPVAIPERLSLAWYRNPDDDAGLSGPPQELRAGQRWRFTLRLRQPHGAMNPHGFDFELYLFERGIGVVGSVRAGLQSPPRHLGDAAGYPVQRLRQAVRDAIQAQVRDPASAGVLAALTVGDQAAIDRDGWDLFRITGVAHLMSISGLHVTMLAWLAGAGIGRLWRLSPRLALRLPAPQAARFGGLAAAFAYAVFAGWGVPAQRTVWMIALVVVLRAGGVRWPLHAVLLAAALLVALADPWALLQPGFWLSFAAVALLVASEPVRAVPAAAAPAGREKVKAVLQGALRTQLIATVGLAPLTLVFFQQLSLVGFIANLLAIPLVTLLVTPLALLGMLLPPLWSLAALLVQGLTAVLQVLASWPLAQWHAAAAPAWAMACGLLAGALAVLPLPWRLRLLALPLVLPLLAPPLQRPAHGGFELVAADVGQGSAVLLRTRHHLLLYDTGPPYGPDADTGSRVLLPLLRSRGERSIDLLVLSHRDADHVGGAASLLAAMPVARIASSLTPDHPLLATGVPHTRCDADAPTRRWQWDGVNFEWLHPLAADHADQRKANALSCVLRVSSHADGAAGTGTKDDGTVSVLLPGDIEAAQEAALLRRAGDALRSDVLLVPHHGSRTSSTAAFIAAVQPRTAVVQAAYRSRFGHPAADVVARYADRGVRVVRSDRCGAWTLQAAAVRATSRTATSATTSDRAADDSTPHGTTEGRCERQSAQRYWHHRAQPEPAAAR